MNVNIMFKKKEKKDQVLDTKSHSNEIYLFIEMCKRDSSLVFYLYTSQCIVSDMKKINDYFMDFLFVCFF